jgi:L-asparaginase II
VDAALGEEFGALRAYTFDHANVSLQAVGHKGSYSQKALGSTKLVGGQFPASALDIQVIPSDTPALLRTNWTSRSPSTVGTPRRLGSRKSW